MISNWFAMAYKIGFPENILICGSSNSGKSTFVEHLLQTPQIWKSTPEKIVYCFGIPSRTVEWISNEQPQVLLMEGVPKDVLSNPLNVFSPNQNNLLIMDDVSGETQTSKDFTNMLSRAGHHCHLTIISIEHALFAPFKERRMQTPHYNQCILFKNQRSLHQIKHIARQCDISSPKIVEYAYKDATSKPHGYLIIDFRNETPDSFRLMTNVLYENGEPPFVYL